MAITQLNLYSTTQNIANLANNVDYNSIGLDLTDISVNFGTTPWTFTIKQGSIIEKDGNRYIVNTADYTLQATDNAHTYIVFTGTAFASSASRGTYDATKGGYYSGGNRSLKYVIYDSFSKFYLLKNDNTTEDSALVNGDYLFINGDVEMTFGSLTLAGGGVDISLGGIDVGGDYTSTNGDITLTNGYINGDLNTYITGSSVITNWGLSTSATGSDFATLTIKKPITVNIKLSSTNSTAGGGVQANFQITNNSYIVYTSENITAGPSSTLYGYESVCLNPGVYVLTLNQLGVAGSASTIAYLVGVYGDKSLTSGNIYS